MKKDIVYDELLEKIPNKYILTITYSLYTRKILFWYSFNVPFINLALAHVFQNFEPILIKNVSQTCKFCVIILTKRRLPSFWI